MRYLTRYMIKAGRPAKRWTDGLETDNLLLAKIDCATRRAFGPDVEHTQVLDQEPGEAYPDRRGKQVYFVDNRWAAIYDLATHAGHPDPDAVADAAIDEGRWILLDSRSEQR